MQYNTYVRNPQIKSTGHKKAFAFAKAYSMAM